MLKYSKHDFTVSPMHDSILVLSMHGETLPVPHLRVDLTISPTQTVEGKKAVKVVDKKPDLQRRFLINSYKQLIEKYNAMSYNNVTWCYIVFEYHQSGNIHSHAHFVLEFDNDLKTSVCQLNSILKELEFNIKCCEVSTVRNPIDSWAYLKKKETKMPSFILVGTLSSDSEE